LTGVQLGEDTYGQVRILMAGYIFNLDSVESLELYVQKGVYSTKQSVPRAGWRIHHEGTLADYATMKAGDNIYFFIERKIFGVGELVNVCGDCKFANFPGASQPQAVSYSEVKDKLVWDEGNWSLWETKKKKPKDQRWVCLFRPAPFFFRTGVDMDEVLSSNPRAFRMLRAFWSVSFLKFDDMENQAFKDIIFKVNEGALRARSERFVFPTKYEDVHKDVGEIVKSAEYGLDVGSMLAACADGTKINHEMALEAGILAQLARKDPETTKVFGEWDYLSHQVIASPFKPVDYMDKMDIFGYGYIKGFDPTRSKYLVVENKKGSASWGDVEQLLRYVDWVKDEYCYGDYSMIEAFLVAHDISQEVADATHDFALRKFTVGRRPAVSLEWNSIALVEYKFCDDGRKVAFEIVP